MVGLATYLHRHPAPRRAAPYPVRQGLDSNHSPEAAQARRPGANQRAPHSLRACLRMFKQGRVRNRPPLSPARLQLRLIQSTAPKAKCRFSKRRRARPKRLVSREHKATPHVSREPNSRPWPSSQWPLKNHATAPKNQPMNARFKAGNWPCMRNQG